MAFHTECAFLHVSVPPDCFGELGKIYRPGDELTVTIQTLPVGFVHYHGIGDLLIALDVIEQRSMAGLAIQRLMCELQHILMFLLMAGFTGLISAVDKR